jgi:hypothetical protein
MQINAYTLETCNDLLENWRQVFEVKLLQIETRNPKSWFCNNNKHNRDNNQIGEITTSNWSKLGADVVQYFPSITSSPTHGFFPLESNRQTGCISCPHTF